MFTLNAWAIRTLANELGEKLAQSRLISCFSSSKDDWYFLTSKGNIHLHFFQQTPYFLFPGNSAIPLKKRIPFIKFDSEQVKEVHIIEGDRVFWIALDHFQVLFNLFGNRSEIYLYENFQPIKRFRKPNEPLIPWPYANRPEAFHDDVLEASDFISLKNKIKSFPDILEEEAAKRNFFNGYNRSEVLKFLKVAFEGAWYLQPAGDRETPPVMQLVKTPDSEVFSNHLDAIHAFSTHVLRAQRFAERKRDAMQTLRNSIKKLELKLGNLQTTLNYRKRQTSFSQKADIIMANLHLIAKGMKEVQLLNFYQNKEEVIVLKPELNPQQNAERYYRKGKQEHVELKHIADTLAETEHKLEKAKKNLIELESAENFADVSRENDSSPIRSKRKIFIFEIEGYEIWVGRNSRENDDLLRNAHKNDLWLHARETKGAHVIIRCGNRPKPPEIVIDRAAQLAAFNSDANGSEWVPVIITERKFVRKKKGLAMGEVIVEREKTIMAEPKP